MFDISTEALKTARWAFQEGTQQLNRHYHEIEDVKQLLSGMSSMSRTMNTLTGLQSDIRRESLCEETLAEASMMIAIKYDNCEEEILSNIDNGKFGIKVTSPTIATFNYHNNCKRINMTVLRELLEIFD